MNPTENRNIDHQALKNRTIFAYNELAEKYAKEWGSKLDLQIAQKFIELVKQEGRVLDIGCGPGHYTKFFSEHRLYVWGIDLSKGMLDQARQIWESGCFVHMDMQRLGFLSNSFDALWVCASFVHIHESLVPVTLRELSRVLMPDGILFLNIAIRETDHNSPAGRFFQCYKKASIFERFLQKANFEILNKISRTVHSNVEQGSRHRTICWENFYCLNNKFRK